MNKSNKSKLIRLSGPTLKSVIELSKSSKRTYKAALELLIEIGVKYYKQELLNSEKVNENE